jgi:hypothetical protein
MRYLSPAMNHFKKYLPQITWLLVLVFLYCMDSSQQAPSLCLFKLIGFSSCPGCGIGHAIHYALHFNFSRSMAEHIFGIPAAIGILYQVVAPFLKTKNNKSVNEHRTNVCHAAGYTAR